MSLAGKCRASGGGVSSTASGSTAVVAVEPATRWSIAHLARLPAFVGCQPLFGVQLKAVYKEATIGMPDGRTARCEGNGQDDAEGGLELRGHASRGAG